MNAVTIATVPVTAQSITIRAEVAQPLTDNVWWKESLRYGLSPLITLLLGIGGLMWAVRNIRMQSRLQLKARVYEDVSKSLDVGQKRLSKAYSELMMIPSYLGVPSLYEKEKFSSKRFWGIMSDVSDGCSDIGSIERTYQIVHQVEVGSKVSVGLALEILPSLGALYNKVSPYLWVDFGDGRIEKFKPENGVPSKEQLDAITDDVLAIALLVVPALDEAKRLSVILQNRLLGEVMGHEVKPPKPTDIDDLRQKLEKAKGLGGKN